MFHLYWNWSTFSLLVLIFIILTLLGPHFIEYLGYEVTPECCVVLKCKVSQNFRDFKERHPAFFQRNAVSQSVVNLLRRTSGRQHEEGYDSAVVQRRTRDQSWQQPWLHRGSPETGNSAGEIWGKEPCVSCGFMYICIFLYCKTVPEFICIYECKHTALFKSKNIWSPSYFLECFSPQCRSKRRGLWVSWSNKTFFKKSGVDKTLFFY